MTTAHTASEAVTPGERFQLLHELGRGGMGVVFLAHDRESGERCAVKVLHPHLTEDETSVARFRTEARTASAIAHPAIVQLRGDIGRLTDGRWYFAMEYLDGQTLTQLVAQRGPLPLAVALDILLPICDAIDLAHAAGIIHRDLKPDNVIVLLTADGHVPKLLDFGIAKLLGEPGVTRPGATPGTTAHMAPEQLRGDPVDRRCDVYALGVLTYQMITGGHLPYDAAEGTLYHAQMTQPPIDPRKRCPTVPEAAVGPILAAIHPDPAQRPGTAGEFVLALAHVLVGQTPATDGMGIVQHRAPRLMRTTALHETLRAPGVGRARGSTSWSYSYVTLLGKGGFGEVYRGVKHGAPGFALPVAIKRIAREHVDNPAFVEMFHQEATTAAVLGEHPNIVKVLDHLTDPSGQLAIVMEYVDGVDLDKLRQTGSLPYSVIIYLISEVLEGLGHAHQLPLPDALSSPQEIAARGEIRGVIHRDMSHHNVMVSWHGVVKVMDFGIAKLRRATMAPGSDMIKGKPGYLSPEQANTAVEIDGRSDLFSVGIMLWELLTGEPLFARHDDYRVAIAAVLFHPIKRPRVFRADVSPALEAVAMRLLERDPAARYQTAHEACAALLACPEVSRSAKAELQQLLRARFPERAPHAPSPPAVVSPPPVSVTSPEAGAATGPSGAEGAAAPWRPEGTTHSHAVGQAATSSSSPARRAVRLGLAALGVALMTAVTIAVIARRQGVPVPASPAATDMSAPERSTAAPRPSTNAPSANAPSAPPTISTVAIATEPANAMLRVEDGTKLLAAGHAPLTVSAPQGTRLQIRAEAPGFAPATTAVAVGALEQHSVTLSLVPLARSLSSSARISDPAPNASPAVKPPTRPRPTPQRPATKPATPDDKILE